MSDTQALNDFFAAWGKTDAGGRARLVALATGDSFYYADPHTPEVIASTDGFLEFVTEFATRMPGASAAVIGPVDLHHRHARANVRFDFGGGNAMVGQYFADLDGAGKITRIVGFVGKGAE